MTITRGLSIAKTTRIEECIDMWNTKTVGLVSSLQIHAEAIY